MDEIALKSGVLSIFPELKSSLDELDGMFHSQVELFEYRTNTAIVVGEKELVILAFEHVQNCWESGSSLMKSAVDTSFAEGITTNPLGAANNQWAWKKLPESLKELHINFWGEESVKARLGLQEL